jgi:hypothetical protein
VGSHLSAVLNQRTRSEGLLPVQDTAAALLRRGEVHEVSPLCMGMLQHVASVRHIVTRYSNPLRT